MGQNKSAEDELLSQYEGMFESNVWNADAAKYFSMNGALIRVDGNEITVTKSYMDLNVKGEITERFMRIKRIFYEWEGPENLYEPLIEEVDRAIKDRLRGKPIGMDDELWRFINGR
jgi:hypothetical protein